jgi:hypothetical protein
MIRPATFIAAAALAVAAIPAAGRAAPPPAADNQRNCFWQLAHGRGAELVCEHRAWLTEVERNDLKRLTRELLTDVRCTVSVRIARKLIDDALDLTWHVFQAPPQPVVCTLDMSSGQLPITATFAPRVVIEGDRAVAATPGLADVKGVNGTLAWPVVQYVNHAPGIRTEMLRMINAYLDGVRPGALARR